MLEIARFGYSRHGGSFVVHALFPMCNEVHNGYRLLLFSIPSCPVRRLLHYNTHVHFHCVLWAHIHRNSAHTCCTTFGTATNAITFAPAHTLLAFESHLGRRRQRGLLRVHTQNPLSILTRDCFIYTTIKGIISYLAAFSAFHRRSPQTCAKLNYVTNEK